MPLEVKMKSIIILVYIYMYVCMCTRSEVRTLGIQLTTRTYMASGKLQPMHVCNMKKVAFNTASTRLFEVFSCAVTVYLQ